MNYPEQINKYNDFINNNENWENLDVSFLCKDICNERHIQQDMIVFLNVLEDLVSMNRYLKVHKLLRNKIPHKDPLIWPGNYEKRNLK